MLQVMKTIFIINTGQAMSLGKSNLIKCSLDFKKFGKLRDSFHFSITLF